jgi:hypothetical protein
MQSFIIYANHEVRNITPVKLKMIIEGDIYLCSSLNAFGDGPVLVQHFLCFGIYSSSVSLKSHIILKT